VGALLDYQLRALSWGKTSQPAQVLLGGAPRVLLDKATAADWSPDGAKLLVIRDTGERSRMEYPVGQLLVESDGCMSHARISPNGDLVAFADHPTRGDDMGYLAVSDLGGNKKVLTPRWSST